MADRVKGLRRSLEVFDKGAVLGAEVIGKIGSLKKSIGRSSQCLLDVRTGNRRTNLEADGEDMLWIFAELISNRPGITTDRITRAIRFSVEGKHADWVILGRPQMKNGMKAIRLKAQPPNGDEMLEDEKVAVKCEATVDGVVVANVVALQLEEEARMKITSLE